MCYSFSPTFVTNVRYGITYQKFPERRYSQGADLASLGFSSNLVSQLLDPPSAAVPRVQLGGFATLSPWESGDGTNTGLIHSFANTNTWLLGQTQLALRRRYPLLSLVRQSLPERTLRRSSTLARRQASCAVRWIMRRQRRLDRIWARFLLGIPAGSMSRSASFAAQDKFFGFFIQDDFKLSPKLTLNVGLRYELETPITERYDRLVAGFRLRSIESRLKRGQSGLRAHPDSRTSGGAIPRARRVAVRQSRQHGRSPSKARRTTSCRVSVWLAAARKAGGSAAATVFLRHAGRQHDRADSNRLFAEHADSGFAG
jgi:hypothetical protein